MAITDFSRIDFSEPGLIEKFSRADLVQLKASSVWTGGLSGAIPAVQQMRELNPDIKVVGYVSVKATPVDPPTQEEDLFFQVWYERTQPYWVYTVTGNVAQDWPTSRIINILDPGCRQAMIETIIEFQRGSLNQLDGVYWDYFNTKLWVPPSLQYLGEPDMDGDGIGHSEDTDEILAFQAAQISLISALRDSLGAGYLQIFNGQRAYTDSTFAALADGLMYELFPTLNFPHPQMASAMDPAYPYSLGHIERWVSDQNGGPYIVLANKNSAHFTDHEDVYTELHSGDQFRAAACSSITSMRPGILMRARPGSIPMAGRNRAGIWGSPSDRPSSKVLVTVGLSPTGRSFSR